MNGTRLVLAAVAALAGLIVLLQGLGVPIGGGFMIGDRTWTVVGAVVIAVAAVVAWREIRRGRAGAGPG